MKNRLRIIGGSWRSRQIIFPNASGLRPTPSRVRETLFNWLRYDIVGARCLDLYAGSGALGFEAASRGAALVVLVDCNPEVCAMLRDNIERLNARRMEVEPVETIHLLSRPPPRDFDLVFIDPPFRQGLIPLCCHRLEENGWLARNAKIYIESEAETALSGIPEEWAELRSKTAGEVHYCLYSRTASE
jgi:16S rRNA (guanine966-N2)-methyltransferase